MNLPTCVVNVRRVAPSDEQDGHGESSLARGRARLDVETLDVEVGAGDVGVEEHGQVVGVHLVVEVLAVDLDKVVVAVLLVLSEVVPEKEVDGARGQGVSVAQRADVQLLVAPLDPAGVSGHTVDCKSAKNSQR